MEHDTEKKEGFRQPLTPAPLLIVLASFDPSGNLHRP